MATGKALDGKPYAGNPHVRFDEGEVAPAAKPRRGSLLYKLHKNVIAIASFIVAYASSTALADTIAIGSGETYNASDLASVTALQSATAITIEEGGTLEYSDSANELVLSTPISGGGTIKTTTGKKMVVLGDNSNFLGDWQLASPVVVSNRYGLGCGESLGVYFKSGATGDTLKFGGAGLTNDVPLNSLEASGLNLKLRDADDFSGPFVQNGLITHKVSLGMQTHDMILRGGIKETGASLSFSMPHESKYNETSVRIESNQVVEAAGVISLGGSNYAIVHYYLDVPGSTCSKFTMSRSYLHCGAENVVPKNNSTLKYGDVELGGKYDSSQWRTAVFDLNGFNQAARSVYCAWYNNVLEDDNPAKFITEVTSPVDRPATLTLTNDLDRTTVTKYTGSVSLDCNGSGTYTFAHLLSTTTGKLTVGDGFTVGFKWNAGWGGDADVKSGGTLVLNSAKSFLGGKSVLSVEEGGVVELTENAVVELKSLVLGGREIQGGTYSRDAFVAAGLGGYVTGTGSITIAEDSASAAVHGTNARDGLLYEMVLTNVTAEGAWATSGNILDGATWSAASPFLPTGLCTFDPSANPTTYAKYGTPEPLSVKEVEVPVSYFNKLHVTNTCNALCFPKNVRTYDEGGGALSTNVYRLGAGYSSLPAGLAGSNMTVRLRFRWDGNIQQAKATCYDQYLFQLYNVTKTKNILALTVETLNPTTQASAGYMRFNVGTDGLYNPYVAFGTNAWYDVFVSIEGIADGKTRTTLYQYGWDSSGEGNFIRTSFDANSLLDVSVGDAGKMCIGSEYRLFGSSVEGVTKWVACDSQSLGSFNGAIAKLEIYDHAMTLEEVNAVMHEPGSGCTLKIGSMNGSADEFAAVGDPQSAAVFDARNDPPRRFRKALTSANPSASIKFAVKPEEERLPRTLRVCMNRQDILTAAPVTVSVNGTEVETVDFGATNSVLVFLRSRLMKADQDGNVTITLARPAGCGGALLFDTVELSGSWAAGVSDSSFADWCFCGEYDFFHSNMNVRKGRLSLPGGVWSRPFIPRRIYGWRKDMCSGGQPIAGKTPWLPVVLLAFDIPAEVIAQGGGTLSFGSADNGSLVELDVLVNGVNVGHIGPGVTKGGSYEVRLPPEVLVEGLNSLVISNSGANFAESAIATSYNSFSFDFIRFKADVPKIQSGMAIIVR